MTSHNDVNEEHDRGLICFSQTVHFPRHSKGGWFFSSQTVHFPKPNTNCLLRGLKQMNRGTEWIVQSHWTRTNGNAIWHIPMVCVLFDTARFWSCKCCLATNGGKRREKHFPTHIPRLSRNKFLIKGYHCKRNKTTTLQHLAIVKRLHGGRVRERESNETAARPLWNQALKGQKGVGRQDWLKTKQADRIASPFYG